MSLCLLLTQLPPLMLQLFPPQWVAVIAVVVAVSTGNASNQALPRPQLRTLAAAAPSVIWPPLPPSPGYSACPDLGCRADQLPCPQLAALAAPVVFTDDCGIHWLLLSPDPPLYCQGSLGPGIFKVKQALPRILVLFTESSSVYLCRGKQ